MLCNSVQMKNGGNSVGEVPSVAISTEYTNLLSGENCGTGLPSSARENEVDSSFSELWVLEA